MNARDELRGPILGLLWQRGPCGFAEVVDGFEKSPGRSWHGLEPELRSTLERLLAEDLVHADAGGEAGATTYMLTPAGVGLLRRWLSPPLPEGTGTISFDPIRTRVVFLEALSPADRLAFVAEAEQAVEKELRRFEERIDPSGYLFSFFAMRGAIRELSARLDWLHEIRQHLEATGRRTHGRDEQVDVDPPSAIEPIPVHPSDGK